MNLLQVRDLSIEFRVPSGTVKAVNGVTFGIKESTTVAIVGESGSGKSTIAQAILGILPKPATITEGEILFRSQKVERRKKQGFFDRKIIDIAKLRNNSAAIQSIRGSQISMIFQEPMTSLSPLHTIGNQIIEAVRLHSSISRSEAKAAVIEILSVVGFPNPNRAIKTYPFELSGGLRQRAMIAMALVCKPALLIADEPTTALDVTIQAQILKLISDLQIKRKMAVLLITHDLGVVANVADSVIVMYKGEVMEAGSIVDIFQNPSHPYLKSLLSAVPRFNMLEGERLKPLRDIKPTTGHLISKAHDITAIENRSSLILKVKNISKSYSVRSAGMVSSKKNLINAVDDVSFEIERGKTLGLVGESGCGKTTLSKIIMRAIDPDQGEVIFNHDGQETDLTSLKARQLIPYRTKYQYIFQDPFGALNPRMTIFDIITEPLEIHKIGDRKYRIEMVKELMDLVGLDPQFLNRYPHSFSGGQRQRISIARSLALRPTLLLCDEPVSALDVSIQAQILNLLKDLQKKLELTYLFVSHNLAVVNYIADNIAVMCAGRLVEMAPREVLFDNPVHPYTKALLSAIPHPDINQKLDFTELMDGRASNPETWPQPFNLVNGSDAKLTEIDPNHFVRRVS